MSTLGKHWKLSEECRAKIGERMRLNGIIPPSQKGIKRTDEYKEKSSIRMLKNNSFKGKKHTMESKLKISDFAKRRICSEETRIKMSFSGKKKYLRCPEIRQRISDKLKGDRCHFWMGGKSKEIYGDDWTELFRHLIRERDKFVCGVCGKNGWVVHHIDYNKKNNNYNNLITLCNKCHSRTNFKRDNWVNHFKIVRPLWQI